VIGPDGRPDPAADRPNQTAGPIAIAGVKPGEVIAVRIESIEPVGCGRAQAVVYRPDPPSLVGRAGRAGRKRRGNSRQLEFLDGLRVPFAPSLGCLGVAPRLACDATTNDTCGPHGGNIDCRDWAPGATAFFRARVTGANLSVGDVHWAMGDGEIGGQGIEGAADVVLTVTRPARIQRAGLEWPWLIRDGFAMTLGGHPDFKTAQRIAYEEMMTLGRTLFNLERSELQARIACVGELRVCQACCPVITVRIAVPLRLFAGADAIFSSVPASKA
ncbi:MAG: acetamidase/formamidase family protein, partial [Planctomycetota bacterium]